MFTYKIDDDTELRLLGEEHAQELFELTDCSRDHLRKWLPWVDATRTVEDSRQFILKSLEQYEKTGAVNAGIWHHGRLAGVISFVMTDLYNRNSWIGYWIGEKYQGRGLMTAACRVMLATAFEDMGLNRVEIRAATDNNRSRSIPERLGFRLEGILRQSAWLDDHFQDMAVYSLLRSEWLKAELDDLP
jgi:ribosomal-protein-serine acetyltransferase